jgi:hypothetical protein
MDLTMMKVATRVGRQTNVPHGERIFETYGHINVNDGNKIYFGSTGDSANERKSDVWSGAYGKYYDTRLSEAIRKFGISSFKTFIFAESIWEEDAKAIEQLFIDEFQTEKPTYGYNVKRAMDAWTLDRFVIPRINWNEVNLYHPINHRGFKANAAH